MLVSVAEVAERYEVGEVVVIRADQYDLGETRRRILAHLREHGALTPKAIAEALELGHETVKKSCQRMATDEQLGTDGDGAYYTLSPPSPASLARGTAGT